MSGFLNRLFGRMRLTKGDPSVVPGAASAADVLEEFSWLFPPRTLVDPAAWDQYWHDQVSHGVAGFVHMFCEDGELVDAMRANGMKTVLCVGNGISQEPRALAWAGFDVTALDLSPLATQVAQEAAPPDEFLAGLVGQRASSPGGHVEFVTGDLCNAACCPGPYDVVIDRKTLQLWPDNDRPMAMRAVANRLATPGIFFSQCHDGGWKPPAEPNNATRRWFVAEGWGLWRPGSKVAGHVAWPFTTTG